MLMQILLYLIRAVVISAIIAGLVQLWVKQPQMKKSLEKRRAVRRAERERWDAAEAWFENEVLAQREWFDKAYEKIPAPWRGGRHRAALATGNQSN